MAGSAHQSEGLRYRSLTTETYAASDEGSPGLTPLLVFLVTDRKCRQTC